MKFRKILAAALVMTTALTFAGCGGTTQSGDSSGDKAASETKAEQEKEAIAFFTDYGDITDRGYNQTGYEACRDFADKNDIEFTYYRPADVTTEACIAMADKAVSEGYNILVMPGSFFNETIMDMAGKYPDVKFVSLEAFYDDPSQVVPDNVFCAIFKEELSGYMAGYSAVKLGYDKLGFLGGMAIPAVIRFGSGFVQGADAAAEEKGISVDINYAYGNQFYGDDEIAREMDKWYKGGTEVVFACGGSIYTSVAEAANKVDGKLIGVDVDQKPVIDDMYGEGITLTSATKGIAPAIKMILQAIVDGEWDSYKGKVMTLGLVSDTDMSQNYEGLSESTLWNDGFTEDDYKQLVSDLMSGKLTVDDSSDSAEPSSKTAKINYFGDLK